MRPHLRRQRPFEPLLNLGDSSHSAANSRNFETEPLTELRRKFAKEFLAPQVGFEPTTLRLTATEAEPKTLAERGETDSHGVRYSLTSHTVSNVGVRRAARTLSLRSLLGTDRLLRLFTESWQRFHQSDRTPDEIGIQPQGCPSAHDPGPTA